MARDSSPICYGRLRSWRRDNVHKIANLEVFLLYTARAMEDPETAGTEQSVETYCQLEQTARRPVEYQSVLFNLLWVLEA